MSWELKNNEMVLQDLLDLFDKKFNLTSHFEYKDLTKTIDTVRSYFSFT